MGRVNVEKQTDCGAILEALHFASIKHRDQRRKGDEASPYINHLIEVADLLARVGGVTDRVVLQSAILHDTLEDTHTTAGELERHFGADVRAVVEELTDDKALPKEERKRLQIEGAVRLSVRARLVKLADKISNVRAVAQAPPAHWSLDRRRAYLDWTERVTAGLRGCNALLEELYDRSLRAGRETLAGRETPVGQGLMQTAGEAIPPGNSARKEDLRVEG